MKHELPIAILLLAIGCLPWIWHHAGPLSASPPIQNSQHDSTITAAIREYSAPVAMQTVAGSSSADSRDFLLQVAGSLENGQPSVGNFEIESRLFKGSMTGNGKFWCSGLGLKKSRFELIPDSESAMITQVCDGRFVYRLIANSDNRKLTFYDLDKLQSEDAEVIGGTRSATWLGRGSITGLLTTLADAFRFEAMKSSADSQHVEILGSWEAHELAKLMINRVNHQSLMPTTDWSTLPRQIPHGVRLRFTNQAGTWQPTEIVFFKADTAKKTNQTVAALTVRFGPIQHQSINDSLFQIDAGDAETSDQTAAYRRRMNELTGENRVAKESNDASESVR